jgi:hypothetical protein
VSTRSGTRAPDDRRVGRGDAPRHGARAVDYAEQAIDRLDTTGASIDEARVQLACGHLQLGRPDEALAALEELDVAHVAVRDVGARAVPRRGRRSRRRVSPTPTPCSRCRTRATSTDRSRWPRRLPPRRVVATPTASGGSMLTSTTAVRATSATCRRSCGGAAARRTGVADGDDDMASPASGWRRVAGLITARGFRWVTVAVPDRADRRSLRPAASRPLVHDRLGGRAGRVARRVREQWPTDAAPGRLRAGWLDELHPHVAVVEVRHDLPTDFGDEGLWARWMELFRRHWPHDDGPHAVFSSDPYVDGIAERFGAEPVVVDAERATVPVSATMIRTAPGRTPRPSRPAGARLGHAALVLSVARRPGGQPSGTTTRSTVASERQPSRALNVDRISAPEPPSSGGSQSNVASNGAISPNDPPPV